MEAFKNIGAFSVDAIVQGIERTFDSDEKQQLFEMVKKLSSNLGEPSKAPKRKKSTATPKIPTKQEIFTNNILPQIKRSVRQYEQDQLHNRQMQLSDKVWNEREFSITNRTNLGQIKKIHEEILNQERVAGARYLLTKFNRGLFYLSIYEQIMNEPNIKEWFSDNLNISYQTAMKYIVSASLIRRCPALLVCDLTFDQLVFHSDSINNYLSEEQEGLKEKLSVAVQLVNGRDVIKVEAGEMQIPGIYTSYQSINQSINRCLMPVLTTKVTKLNKTSHLHLESQILTEKIQNNARPRIQ